MHHLTKTNPLSATKKRLLIIGAGMSGTKFASELVHHTKKYAITLFNQEECIGYNRIMLSPVLAGEKQFKDTLLHTHSWYKKHNIDIRLNESVSYINTDKQYIGTKHGAYHYDHLIIATGAKPLLLPLKNSDAQGVLTFRTKQDVETILSYARAKKHSRCTVIGAGLLGLEAANALAKHGVQVTVVHHRAHILSKQLNTIPATLLQQRLEAKGVRFLMGMTSERVLVNDQHQVSGLQFSDGSHISTDSIIMAVGIEPNIELAQTTDIACDQGILVNAKMQTNIANIFALGECVQFKQQLFGLVAPTYTQARVLAEQLTGQSATLFKIEPTATKLKVSDIDLFSAGDITDNSAYEFIEYQDLSNAVYKRLSILDNRIVGIVLYGEVLSGSWFFDLMIAKTNISGMRQHLLFGQAFCDSAA